ncbi:conserved hypothetical protein [Desulforapulum autotrophicum HRM2]|uniref:Putative nickel insertion protein n=1 Tax=Desulforapulum autotrophicum (strain ATCC 43914 / DSM 3382 / VKM B-1955 / HRM2) TaxID=177437 RepID=C0QI92_DESAH|nr:nickel pincer cofactor biosynthesis protein LarC [Desulforapulum autotrophicum]ACN15828.1 conserved hypothetical protein [Desulforapulum autotrophicum HRM2]
MIAYFDLISGISGDMTLGALVDLGVPVPWLKTRLSALPLNGFDIRTKAVWQNGIRGVDLFVDADTHVHSKDYKGIRQLIADAPLSDRVKAQSLEAFEKIGVAESKIHGADLETVHFHEVGGIDAIVDIVGSFLCVEYLEINAVHASVVPLGHGWVECSHGSIPVPVPATLAILKGVPVRDGGVEMEMVTPTGAAIITTLCDSFGPMPEMTITGIGYGSGKNRPEPGSGPGLPNLLRVVMGASTPPGKETGTISTEKVVVIETSTDDMSPEISGYLMEKLLKKGALDVCHIPVQMKKNRPGTRLEVVCRKDQVDTFVRLILSESSSIGVRFQEVERAVLARREILVSTTFGMLQAKQITRPDASVQITPEYEVCRKIADERGVPLGDVYAQLLLDMNPGRL